MKPEHQYYKEVNSKDGEYYRRWAAYIGPYTKKFIDRVLLASEHEEQAYNSCNDILHMCKDQSKLLIEEISKTCVESNTCRYSYFKRLLKENLNKQTFASKTALPDHENLRGGVPVKNKPDKQLTIEEYEICSRLKSMRFSGMAAELEKVFSDPNADLIPFDDKIQRIVDAEWNLRYTKKLNRFIKNATLSLLCRT